MIPGCLTPRSTARLSDSVVPRGGSRRPGEVQPVNSAINSNTVSCICCTFATSLVLPTHHTPIRSVSSPPPSHLCPVAACWRWSIWPGSTSSELSERTEASATFLTPSLCPAQAPRHWHLPAGCHRPPCRPPGGNERNGEGGGKRVQVDKKIKQTELRSLN